MTAAEVHTDIAHRQLPDFTVGGPDYVFADFINEVRRVPAKWSIR